MLILMSTYLSGQSTLTITVYGNCGMCQDRIENAAKNVIGVNTANWDDSTLKLVVSYQEGLFEEDDLHSELVAAGHDTDKMTTTDEIYDNLHGCCKYERPSTATDTNEKGDSNEPDITTTGRVLHGDHYHSNSEVAGMIYERTADGVLQPLIGANVHWAHTTAGATTDAEGHFTIDRNESQSLLVISYIGYQTDTVDMTGQSLIAATMISNHLMDEVNITHKRRSTEVSFVNPIKTQNITQKELCKAACCSLSESFETSPAIDVSFTDAVTGTRKIEMLGLAGPYVQIMRENMPYIRGLSAVAGLSHTPGPWIESMQLNLGTGSVVNGPESMTGQINVEIKKPETSEKLYLNLFANAAGRLEANANTYFDLNSKWSTAILAHGSVMNNSIDNNDDGFYDMPLRDQVLIMNRWKYVGDDGLRFQMGGKYTRAKSTAGQIPSSAQTIPWVAQGEDNVLELWTKVGKVWEGDPFKSLGWQTSFVNKNLRSNYDNAQYNGDQSSLYSNLIYMDAIANDPKHKYKLGASIQYDDISENVFVSDAELQREEVMPGAFAEYSYIPNEQWTVVLGLRGDYHNLYGAFATPRLHVRYAPQDKLAMRIAAGRGQRTASIFAENLGIFASNRSVQIQNTDSSLPYGLDAEVAWNMGANVTKEFDLAGMSTVIGVDYYYTYFEQQTVVDWDISPLTVGFYNLQGNSSAHSLQVQADIELTEGLELRTAYRYNDVQTLYQVGELQKPLVSRHRAFVNVAAELGKGWSWDGTVNWQGSKRLPTTADNPTEFQVPTTSPSFTVVNTQVTKTFGNALDIYLGAENLLAKRQLDPIISADDPTRPYFDGSLVWGPVFGRNVYIGLRWRM